MLKWENIVINEDGPNHILSGQGVKNAFKENQEWQSKKLTKFKYE